MRKIEKDMIAAIKSNRNWKCKNTEVFASDSGPQVYLHGHLIAKFQRDNSVIMSLCGWNTVTTRSRLNAICREFGLDGFSQRNHAPFYGDEEIESRDAVTAYI